MKGKVLSFPFISFSESGLFNGLRPIQIKKIFPFIDYLLAALGAEPDSISAHPE
jgi:hypothetical protein